MKRKIFILFYILTISTLAFANDETVPYPINQIIGINLTKGQSIEIVADILYPNGCFHPSSTKGVVDEDHNNIFLLHSADIFEGICTQATVHKYPFIEITKPRTGVYKIIDSANSKYLGGLSVDEATVHWDREVF